MIMFKASFFISFFVIVALMRNISAQVLCSITASASDTLLCNADSVYLLANGSIYTLEMMNDFNDGTLGVGWAATSSASVTSSMCVPHPNGTNYLWMANTPAPRSLESIDFDILNGGSIEWDMRYSIQGVSSPCEGPDEADEGVALQYSTNGGGLWVDWLYFQPDGNVLTSIPTSNTGVVTNGQTTVFTDWNTQTWNIPIAAHTNSTRFRWFQANATDAEYDNWGVEDIEIRSAKPSHLYWTSSPATYISNDTIANPTVFVTQTTVFTVTITNGTDSCSSTITVEVAPSPNAEFATDSIVCTGNNANIQYLGNAPSSAQYLWDFNGGTIVSGSGQGPYSVNWSSQGNYEVSLQVIVGDCVSDSIKKLVSVYEMNVIASNDTTVCQEQPLTLVSNTIGGFPAYSYSWSNGAASQNIIVNPINDSEYIVVATDQYQCSVSDTVHVFVTPIDGSIYVDTIAGLVSHQFSFEWIGSSGSNYLWDFGDGTTASGLTVEHVFPYEGLFTVTLTVTGNPPSNCERILTIIISVFSPFHVETPNVFTPNGDGFNDAFFVAVEGQVSTFKLVVYNRWGKEVFVSTDVSAVWDGSVGSVEAHSGTYFYVVEITPAFGTLFTSQGTVTLLRE